MAGKGRAYRWAQVLAGSEPQPGDLATTPAAIIKAIHDRIKAHKSLKSQCTLLESGLMSPNPRSDPTDLAEEQVHCKCDGGAQVVGDAVG